MVLQWFWSSLVSPDKEINKERGSQKCSQNPNR
jgi:hypothetical protein